jgi:uncharacterized protein (UPF0332 family)
MKPEERDYLEYRMIRAAESLDVARLALGNNHLQDAVNRLYYACFYMVTALLQTKGLASGKHSGVRALFNQNWIKTGVLPHSIGRFYQEIFERRQEGDYADLAAFNRDDVIAWMRTAEEFVSAIAALIEEHIQNHELLDG